MKRRKLVIGEIPRPATTAAIDQLRMPTHRDLRYKFHRAFSYAWLQCHDFEFIARVFVTKEGKIINYSLLQRWTDFRYAEKANA
jgi:hypothetical protein